jgi:hypothetical protein
MYILNLAGTRACPRAFHARGWRARAWFVARGGSRARARAGDLAYGRGRKKVVSAGTTPVAIFTYNSFRSARSQDTAQGCVAEATGLSFTAPCCFKKNQLPSKCHVSNAGRACSNITMYRYTYLGYRTEPPHVNQILHNLT